MSDLISRQAAIELMCRALHYHYEEGYAVSQMMELPSAQPERLSDDDFETIRIHLNAYKEKLCNQHRCDEAEEYQRIIDRFIAFVSAQPEIIRCKDCKYFAGEGMYCENNIIVHFDHFYCYNAERRTDESND